MLFRRLLFLAALLTLSIAVPTSAHDLPMGGSRWSFGQNTIRGFVDLKSPLFAEIKPIKEGHLNPDSASVSQLQQLGSEVLQPYITQRLSVIVNGTKYPVRVDKLVRNDDELYTIWLSVDHVAFDRPISTVKISYSVLLEETNFQHVNIAFGYVSDASGAALQKVFDYSPPAFQTTFDAKNTVWQVSVKGAPSAVATEQKTPNAPAKTGLEVAGNRVTQEPKANITPSRPHDMADAQQTQLIDSPAVAQTPAPIATSSSAVASDATSQQPGHLAVWATVRQFVPLGVEHILTGYDHIAFLLAIIVVELSIKDILKIITAFTAAHSITLLLAALEIVRLNSRFVESVIAFSICYVAVENLFKKKLNYRWVITFAFGLIHGFGFASVLRELIVGKSNLLLSVVAFNFGVEIGQLLLFFLLLPVLYLLKKQLGFRMVAVSTSLVVLVIGASWLVERVFRLKVLWF